MYVKPRSIGVPATAVAALALMMSGAALATPPANTGGTSASAASSQPQQQPPPNQTNKTQAKTNPPQNENENQQAKASAPKTSASSSVIIDKQKSSQKLANSIIGLPVKNGTGKKAATIGDISNLVLNKNNKVVAVVVGVGGFLGIGQKNVGVTFDKVQFHAKAKSPYAMVHVTKKQLSNAPAYETLADQQHKQKEQQQKQKAQHEARQRRPANGGAAAANGGVATADGGASAQGLPAKGAAGVNGGGGTGK